MEEFDYTIKNRKGIENVVVDHLSCVKPVDDDIFINDTFPDESLYVISSLPWYADIVNYLVVEQVPKDWNNNQRNKFFAHIKYYFWEEPELFRLCADQIIRRCVPEEEMEDILRFCHDHACGGHFGPRRTVAKVLQSGFYWPTLFKDVFSYCQACQKCQKSGSMTKRNMMPLSPILIIEIFDVWGIDFMGPFVSSNGFQYILLAVDCVSKWVEAIPTRTNDHKVVVKFLKQIFSRFGTP